MRDREQRVVPSCIAELGKKKVEKEDARISIKRSKPRTWMVMVHGDGVAGYVPNLPIPIVP